jgi:alpha-glucosidase (family GH31 glycosyl hydrolase)
LKIRKFLITGFLALLGLFFFIQAQAAANDASGLAWGVNAMTLQSACSNLPSWDDLLTNDADSISLKDFYCAGGVGVAGAPTECRVAYDSDSLLVAFRCRETNMMFAAMQHATGTNWFSLIDSPPDFDSTYPDKVELFIRPDRGRSSYYDFIATKDGTHFAYQWRSRSSHYVDDDDDTSSRVSIVSAFDATVSRGTNEWIVFLRIPWKTLGGQPRDHFGLLPVRTRWRDGEVSSPVAFDFGERPPTDLFIETYFSRLAPFQIRRSSLCQLPSGALRWQRPALLVYPDVATVHQIWQMEQSLNTPTDENNFAERLFLTQRWIDLMTLEGFNFRLGRGSIVEKNLTPATLRQKINAALQQENLSEAYESLDDYLAQLDLVTRQWFADGTPGDIGAWAPVTQVESAEREDRVLALHCRVGSQLVDLHLSFPKSGGVRVYGNEEGYFKPDSLMPLNLIQSVNTCSIATRGGKAVVRYNPFSILFINGTGKPATEIGPGDLAFRFDANGKTTAVDFKNHLDPDEVIYGFGEKYNHFDENGSVLTLWGMDDWSGNTFGLRNQSYKPIELFHSSKGYTIFDNSTYRLRADIGRTDTQQYRLTQQGPVFDYYVWTGSPEKAIRSCTSLTGEPILPPKWAFEPWMGRTGRGWTATSHNAVAEEERVTKRFAELDIPHSAIYSEGPGAESRELNQFMAARGIKVLSWFYPVISGQEQARLLPQVKTNDLPVLNAGSPRATKELGYVDFTNPNALDLFRQWWKKRLDLGVAGSMVDFGDRVTPDAVFYDGRRGDEMHNFYAYDYHRTCNEVFSEKRGDDFILFGRAAAPGDQRWVGQFGGDHPSNFIGLQSVMNGALNLCACGFSTWGSDLGGFVGWPEPAVFERWTQFGCFSPLMRCHGRTPREPWNYGDAAVANYKYFTWVRENLLDYIYNAAAGANETGIPIMRSMPVAFPDDAAAAAANSQYMFGPDLLVAPVITEDNVKDIFLPSGQWTSLWTGETTVGPTNLAITVPLDSIPVYLKPGAIVPVALNDSLQFGQSMTGGRVKALIVTPPDKDEEAQFPYDAEPVSREPATKTPDTSVALHPETNGFMVTLNHYEPNCLLVYGVGAAKSIMINGVAISNGWQVDPAIKRLVIKLPKGAALADTAATNVEILF